MKFFTPLVTLTFCAATLATLSACNTVVFTTASTVGLEVNALESASQSVKVGYHRFEGVVMPHNPEDGAADKTYSVRSMFEMRIGRFLFPAPGPERRGVTIEQVFATGKAATSLMPIDSANPSLEEVNTAQDDAVDDIEEDVRALSAEERTTLESRVDVEDFERLTLAEAGPVAVVVTDLAEESAEKKKETAEQARKEADEAREPVDELKKQAKEAPRGVGKKRKIEAAKEAEKNAKAAEEKAKKAEDEAKIENSKAEVKKLKEPGLEWLKALKEVAEAKPEDRAAAQKEADVLKKKLVADSADAISGAIEARFAELKVYEFVSDKLKGEDGLLSRILSPIIGSVGEFLAKAGGGII